MTMATAPSVGDVVKSSFDVLDARGRVALELPLPLPQEKLDGGEITLLNGQVLAELGSGESLKVFTRRIWFLACFSQTLAVQAEYFFL